MLFESSGDNAYLQHYGVPGMKWGVITKQYQKKGYDHRYDHTQFKTKQANAAAKLRRKQMVKNYAAARKRKTTDSMSLARQRARQLGASVGENLFYEARSKERKRIQEEYRARHPKKGIIDKGIEKVAKKFGLSKDQARHVSKFVKEQGKSLAVSVLSKKANKGAFTIKGSKTVGKILSKPVGAIANPIGKLSYKAAEKIDPKNVVKGTVKGTAKATYKVAKGSAKAAKAVYKGGKWLKNGGYVKLRTKAQSIAEGARTVRKHAHETASFVRKNVNKGTRMGAAGVRSGTKAVRKGVQATTQGAMTLAELLNKKVKTNKNKMRRS